MRVLLGVGLLLVLDPTAISSQPTGALSTQELVEAVRAATKLKVRLVDGTSRVLHYPAWQGDAVSGWPRARDVGLSPPVAIPVARLVRVEIPGGRRTGHGAAIGATVGGAWFLIALSGGDEDTFFKFSTGEVVAGTLVGSALGAFVGALFGHHATRWRTVYFRPLVPPDW